LSLIVGFFEDCRESIYIVAKNGEGCISCVKTPRIGIICRSSLSVTQTMSVTAQCRRVSFVLHVMLSWFPAVVGVRLRPPVLSKFATAESNDESRKAGRGRTGGCYRRFTRSHFTEDENTISYKSTERSHTNEPFYSIHSTNTGETCKDSMSPFSLEKKFRSASNNSTTRNIIENDYNPIQFIGTVHNSRRLVFDQHTPPEFCAVSDLLQLISLLVYSR